MIKLYRKSEEGIHYWETWDHNGMHTVHWGKLGERGQSKELKSSLFRSATKAVQAQIEEKKAEGYQEIPVEEHHVSLIEYAVQGMGTTTDLDKRHRLESRMDEILGWTGLGHCDGGSIGSGTMEVCCLVVDFETAVKVIAAELRDTEFADYTRIYKEDA
jgi:predicted DNA-binding WGR domain protein